MTFWLHLNRKLFKNIYFYLFSVPKRGGIQSTASSSLREGGAAFSIGTKGAHDGHKGPAAASSHQKL